MTKYSEAQLPNEVKQALIDFKKAAEKLTELWEDLPYEQHDKLGEHYPVHLERSFDEVTADIRQWVNHHTQK